MRRSLDAEIDLWQQLGVGLAILAHTQVTEQSLDEYAPDAAAFEFGALYLRWLEKNGETDLEPAAKAFDAISQAGKSLILKTARAVGAKKDVDLSAMLSEIETQWDAGMGHLVKRYGVT